MLDFEISKSKDFSLICGMDPFKSIAVPRPIAWISTVSKDGVDNLAPYSQFTNVGFNEPHILFAAQLNSKGKRKDTVINAEETRCFVHNMVTYDLREPMNISSLNSEPDVDEFEQAGLHKLDSTCVKAKRVAESPIQMECEYVTTVRLPGANPMSSSDLVIGRVVCIHVDENYVLPNGKLDILKLRPLARLGYADYTSVTDVFEMRAASMMKTPIPGGYGWMSPKSLEFEATHKNL